VIARELAKVPRAVGLNVTLRVQDLLVASVKGGVIHWPVGSLTEKGALGCVMFVTVSGAVPVFLSVTVFVAVVPTARFPKFGLVLLKDAVCARSCVAEPKPRRQTHASNHLRVKQLIGSPPGVLR